MRKIYSLLLLLTTFLFTGNLAYADYTLKIQWETPGSIELGIGTYAGKTDPVDVANVTEYVQTVGSFSVTCFVISPTGGYTLVKAVQNEDNSVVIEPNAEGKIVLGPTTGMYDSKYANKTFTIYCDKVAQNEEFNINVINGLDYIKANFASGAALTLEKGEHSYAYNSDVDKTLTITPKGIPTLYSVTLDGTPIQKDAQNVYKDIPVANGSNLVIQAFENPAADAPETCKLTFEYGEGMEGCINTIRDWTTNSWLENNIVNNVLDVQGYTDLQLNFVQNDYTITKVYLNGENITSELITSSFDKSQKIRFIVPNKTASTIKIEGTAKVWGTVNFTGYISGAEGVEFSETYQGAAMTMPEGEAITNSFSVGSYQLNASNAKKYVFPISEKTAKMFFRPKAGYYIAEFYVSKTNTPNEQNSGAASIIENQDGTYFWMVVKPLGDTYTFDMTTVGSTYSGRLSSADQSIISIWDNPEGLKVTLEEGNQVVTFYPDYNIPALISVFGDDTKSPAAYLDGAALTGALNKDSNATEFTFTPYYPVAGDGIPAGSKSDVQVYLSTARPSMSGASLELEEGLEAEFYYSIFRHVADPAGQAVISGTQMIVKPANPEAIVTYKNEVVTLNENGEFVFNATGNSRNNIVSIALPAKYADMLVQPADGATVKTLSTVKVTLPAVDPDFESMLDYNEEVLAELNVKSGDEVVATFGELGEPTADDEGNTIVPIILSTPITAAGTYTINIPEKAFVQKAWSEADEAMVPVKGGFVTPAYSGTVTVDPNMISVCDDYVLSPASGETVEEISVVKVSFNKISAEEYFSGWEFPNATFTNGDTTIQAIVNYDWTNEGENRVMTVTPIDASEEPAAITAAGTWTMTIPAGAFSYNDETNAEITAEYIIAEPKFADMLVDPADGATVKTLTTVKVTLPAVDPNFESMLDYNEEVLAELNVKSGDEVVATFGELGEPTADDEGNTIVPIILSTPITAAGTYTINIPEKAFVQKAWSEADEAMVPVKGGFVTPAYSGTVTVDPNMISVCDDYTLSPASGETVEEISVVKVSFNKISAEEYFSGWEFPNATFTNGETTIQAIVNYDWTNEGEYRVMTVTPIDASEEPAAITAAGKWTMTIAAGTFSYNGETNAEITAEYTVVPPASAISEIFADENGNVTVYSVDGKVVLNNVPAAEIRNLNNGLYIINGKKVMVK